MKAAILSCILAALAPICGAPSHTDQVSGFAPIGELEVPAYGTTVFGITSVAGWALDVQDTALGVPVYVDGNYVGQALYPCGLRPDIQAAYTSIAHSLYSGFLFPLDTRAYPDGDHQISVRAQNSSGDAADLGVNTVNFDNTTQAVARPWPDTTTGVYVFNDQLTDQMTLPQMQFAATQYSGCQKMTRSMADGLRIYNPDFLILHYRLGPGLGYRTVGGDWLMIIEGNNWVREWPDSPLDEWFYLYEGSREYQNQWGWYLCDLDNASWRSYWIGEVLRQLGANDDDGVFADSLSVPNYLGGTSFTPPLPDYDISFETEWSGKIERWIAYVKGQFGSTYRLIPNVGLWVTTRDQTDYSGADGVMIEGFGMWSQGDPFDLSDWQLQMDRILGLVSQGKTVIAQSYVDDPADTSFRMFTLANYLLIKGTSTFVNMDMGMEVEWFPEYSVDLGAYTGSVPTSISQLYRSDWGVYARQYVKGMALVNPGTVSRTFDVGSGYQRVVPHGGGNVPEDGSIMDMYLTYEDVTSITLAPHTGAVLVTSGPTPATLSVTPSTGLSSGGTQGGPFTPSSAGYTLENTGGEPMDWTASHLAEGTWVTVSPTSGTLAAGAQTTVTVTINGAANLLTPGTYNDTVTFTNTTSGFGNTTRAVQLMVAQPGAPAMVVTPADNLSSSGSQGGPFSPDRLKYTVSNTGGSPLDFMVTHQIGNNWLTVYRTLEALQSTDITIMVNALAAALSVGDYTDTVTFTNLINGQGNTTRTAHLTVTGGALGVTPADGLVSTGQRGGPFSPSSKVYTLTNTGGVRINWSVTHNAGATWVSLSAASGALDPGASTTVTVSINSSANSLARGVYDDTVTFTNLTTGQGTTTRGVRLTVVAGSLAVSPADGLTSSGPMGGPFTPSSKQYTLTNTGDAAINWTATHSPSVNWVDLTNTSGTLAVDGTATVTVSINSNAAALAGGVYSDTVTFTNTTNGDGNTTRGVQLTVLAGRLQVVPADGLTSTGAVGGPFSPISKQYTISNPGTAPINWTAAHNPSINWLDLTNTSGTLAAGGSATVTVSINSNANSLPQGSYTDAVVFANTTNGQGNTSRPVLLTASSKALSSVDVVPTTMGCPSTDPRQIHATAYFTDSTSLDITSLGTWSSSRPTVATVSSSGVVTPRTNGAAVITCTYTYAGVTRSDTCAVTVSFQTLLFLYLTPSSYTFYQRTPAQFNCLARLTSGWLNVTEQCQWSSTSTSVAVVDQHGLVTPVSNGYTAIKATYLYYGVPKTIQAGVNVQLF